MTPADHDQSSAATFASLDAALIPGIYNYCDRRCGRCRFTARCLVFRTRSADPGDTADRLPMPEMLAEAFARTFELLRMSAVHMGLDPAILEAEDAAERGPDDALEDPLVRRGRDYAHATFRIAQALAPLLEARGDPDLVEAVHDVASLSTTVASKLYRAVIGAHGGEASEVQSDSNGSAKCARLFIADSIRAWRVLMEAGRAAADGVPARLVAELQAIDAAVLQRFPNAMAFIRPGFDTDLLS
jgi:hypothetical protein